jgi:hypothetical protein
VVEIALDTTFITSAILIWFCIGYPLTLPMQRIDPTAIILAPVLGLSIFAIVVTCMYRYGVSLHMSSLPALLWALVGLALFARHISVKSLTRGIRLIVLSFLFAALLIALPGWLGNPEFAAFQGNHWDHLNYISYTSAYRLQPYDYFRAVSDAEALRSGYFDFAASQLSARPTVGMVLGSFLGIFGGPTMRWSYIYLAALQTLMFFSALHILLAGFRANPFMACLASIALTCGFFMQYAFDINAWSQLAAMPIALALVSVLAFATTAVNSSITLRLTSWSYVPPLATLAAGCFYLYPEGFFVYGPACLAVLGYCFFTRAFLHDRLPAALTLAALSALILCIPAWQSTAGHLLRQLQLASTRELNWHIYFQCYLMDADCRVAWPILLDSPVRWLVTAYSFGVHLLAGMFGLYFILPSTNSSSVRIAAEALSGFVVVAIIVASGLGIRRTLAQSTNPFGHTIVFAMATSLLVAAALAVSERYWPAGKALTLAAPLIFIVLCLPLVSRTRIPRFARVTAWAIVLAHLGFGVIRPFAATAATGVHYKYPRYPSAQDPRMKVHYSWDTARLATLRSCNLVQLDIDNPFLDRFVQVFLSDTGVDWFSARTIKSYYSEGRNLGIQSSPGVPDCLATTEMHARDGFKTVVWLRRDHN